jgi:hypothetical protein
MDKATLVNFEIEKGQLVLDALDKVGKSPEVALWAMLPEYETWRLVLSSSHLRDYRDLLESLQRAGLPSASEPIIFLREFDSPFVKELRKSYSGKDNWGNHIGGRFFGDQYVDDAYVYRIR